MEKLHGDARSHLFTIRLWKEDLGAEQSEWRGKIQLVTGGEVRYFRDWDTLVPLLLSMLSESESDFMLEPDKQS